MDELSKKRGGRREGAGRKSKSGEATTVKRIPISLIPAVDALITSSRLPQGSLIPINRTTLKVPYALEEIPAGFPSHPQNLWIRFSIKGKTNNFNYLK